MSGETARLMAARDLILKWWPEHGGSPEFLITAIEWRDAATRRDALEEAAKICEDEASKWNPDEDDAQEGCVQCSKFLAFRIRRAAQQPCPARREDVATD